MSLNSMTNQYPGINPHLNSALQAEGREWKEFHNIHIVHLHDLLNERLEDYGYEAKLVSGLQISTLDSENNQWQPPHSIDPDVAIISHPGSRPGSGSIYGSLSNSAAQEMPTSEALGVTDTDYFNAIALHKVGGEGSRPVAWIELLSPSNKPGEAHWGKYEAKRLALLGEGIPLVEVDYLHQTRSTILRLPQYPKEAGSHPYKIAAHNPEPSEGFEHGKTAVYSFDVNMPIPTVTIPFNDGRSVDFDFASAYDYTLAKKYHRHIDYTQRPVNFDTYSQSDKNQIEARMYTVLKAANQGLLDKDQPGPLPLACPVDEGHAYLASILPDNTNHELNPPDHSSRDLDL